MNPDTKLFITSAADDISSPTGPRLVINIYSDANFLAVNILENLLSKNCLVNIVTDDVEKWRDLTVYITNKSRFSIFNESDFINIKSAITLFIVEVSSIRITFIKS